MEERDPELVRFETIRKNLKEYLKRDVNYNVVDTLLVLYKDQIEKAFFRRYVVIPKPEAERLRALLSSENIPETLEAASLDFLSVCGLVTDATHSYVSAMYRSVLEFEAASKLERQSPEFDVTRFELSVRKLAADLHQRALLLYNKVVHARSVAAMLERSITALDPGEDADEGARASYEVESSSLDEALRSTSIAIVLSRRMLDFFNWLALEYNTPVTTAERANALFNDAVTKTSELRDDIHEIDDGGLWADPGTARKPLIMRA